MTQEAMKASLKRDLPRLVAVVLGAAILIVMAFKVLDITAIDDCPGCRTGQR